MTVLWLQIAAQPGFFIKIIFDKTNSTIIVDSGIACLLQVGTKPHVPNTDPDKMCFFTEIFSDKSNSTISASRIRASPAAQPHFFTEIIPDRANSTIKIEDAGIYYRVRLLSRPPISPLSPRGSGEG